MLWVGAWRHNLLGSTPELNACGLDFGGGRRLAAIDLYGGPPVDGDGVVQMEVVRRAGGRGNGILHVGGHDEGGVVSTMSAGGLRHVPAANFLFFVTGIWQILHQLRNGPPASLVGEAEEAIERRLGPGGGIEGRLGLAPIALALDGGIEEEESYVGQGNDEKEGQQRYAGLAQRWCVGALPERLRPQRGKERKAGKEGIDVRAWVGHDGCIEDERYEGIDGKCGKAILPASQHQGGQCEQGQTGDIVDAVVEGHHAPDLSAAPAQEVAAEPVAE